MTRINVLSLFGGIECGRVAMDRLGWDIGTYYSSEIDEYAKKITTARWPEIVHLWDVRDISYFPIAKVLQVEDRSTAIEIDILIGGSPCQDLSIAKAGGKGLEGEKSGLFYEYVRILEEVQPKYFILENVASMRKADKDKISEVLGIDPIMINSNLVSAQNRKRLYWVGRKIEGGGYEKVEIQQPEDRGILLADILEDIPLEDERWKPLDPKYFEKLQKYDWGYSEHNSVGKIRQGYEYFTPDSKVSSLTVAHARNRKVLVWQFRRTDLRVHSEQDKVCTLTSNMGTGGNNVPILLVSEKAYPVTATYAGACPRDYLEKNQRELVIAENEDIYLWRKLTVKECERLQTLPDDYTEGVSNSRRYKAIGNWWTVDIIGHILSFCNT